VHNRRLLGNETDDHDPMSTRDIDGSENLGIVEASISLDIQHAIEPLGSIDGPDARSERCGIHPLPVEIVPTRGIDSQDHVGCIIGTIASVQGSRRVGDNLSSSLGTATMKITKRTSMTSTIGVTFGAACTDPLIGAPCQRIAHDAEPPLARADPTVRK
jgi:hypothetical protein